MRFPVFPKKNLYRDIRAVIKGAQRTLREKLGVLVLLVAQRLRKEESLHYMYEGPQGWGGGSENDRQGRGSV